MVYVSLAGDADSTFRLMHPFLLPNDFWLTLIRLA